jgi:phospholipase C
MLRSRSLELGWTAWTSSWLRVHPVRRRPQGGDVHADANDFAGKKTTIVVPGGKHSVVSWPTEDGYYDVIITANESADFKQRYAGRAAQK